MSQTAYKSYPWQVGLINKETEQIECGCALLSKEYILSAAHCKCKLFKTALIGRNSINEKNKIHDIKFMRKHPKYEKFTDGGLLKTPTIKFAVYDFMILRLKKKLSDDLPYSSFAWLPLKTMDEKYLKGKQMTTSG